MCVAKMISKKLWMVKIVNYSGYSTYREWTLMGYSRRHCSINQKRGENTLLVQRKDGRTDFTLMAVEQSHYG